MSLNESEDVLELKSWLTAHGGSFHKDATFTKVLSGYNILAAADIQDNTAVASCPFSLAITPEQSRNVLYDLLKPAGKVIDVWNERQLMSTYIALHWLLPHSSKGLNHGPYIKILPSSDQLLTSLHFKDTELDAFQGSNVYGATIDRKNEWKDEWTTSRAAVVASDATLEDRFTWDMYLKAATYISSRAFPSTLLSPNPSLESTPTSHPILLPGIDSFNHARAHPVSWVVNYPKDGENTKEPCISLTLRSSTSPGKELLNNYGAKPNSELILGYGFTLPCNPDDTIVLQIGGTFSGGSGKFEVGRDARGVEAVWGEVFDLVCEDDKSEEGEDEDPKMPYENTLQAAQMLVNMVEGLIDRLPARSKAQKEDMRPEVGLMLDHYLEGQHEILQSILVYAQQQEKKAIDEASAQGIELVFED